MNRTWSPLQAAFDTHTTPAPDELRSDDRYSGKQQRPQSSTALSEPTTDKPVWQIKSETMSFRNMHQFGELLPNYLEARKAIFLDRLGWQVSEADGMEFDQYDTPFCRWIVLHQYGEILGGVRMLPTTAKCGTYSYMIRDAQRGILEDLPSDILFFDAPVEHSVWEATRFFITDAVPAKRRQDVQKRLFKEMSLTAMENGATFIIGIVPSVWSRWARRLGINATPVGAKFSINGTSSQSVLFAASDFVL